jgi:hypothetical protein
MIGFSQRNTRSPRSARVRPVCISSWLGDARSVPPPADLRNQRAPLCSACSKFAKTVPAPSEHATFYSEASVQNLQNPSPAPSHPNSFYSVTRVQNLQKPQAYTSTITRGSRPPFYPALPLFAPPRCIFDGAPHVRQSSRAPDLFAGSARATVSGACRGGRCGAGGRLPARAPVPAPAAAAGLR